MEGLPEHPWVSYHERMHTTIWKWIEGWCKRVHISRDYPHGLIRLSPMDVLSELLTKIEVPVNNAGRLHPNNPTYWVADSERQVLVGDFFDVISNVIKLLWRISHQYSISWHLLKRIIQFYLGDSESYINNINSLGMTARQQNEYFDLGIDFEEERDTMTSEEFRNRLIFSRYLTGTKIFNWSERLQAYETYHLARGEEYWSVIVRHRCCDSIGRVQAVQSHGGRLPPSQSPPSHSRPKPVEPIHPTKRKLTELFAFIDEKKEIWSMNEGDYLKISGIMKEAFEGI